MANIAFFLILTIRIRIKFIVFNNNSIMAGLVESSKEFNKVSKDADMSSFLKEIVSLGQEKTYGDFTKDEARGIYIRGYGISHADDKKPILGTNQMWPCIAIALYNPSTKVGAVAHFDTKTDISSLKDLISLVGGETDKIEVHLAGGQIGNSHSLRLGEEIAKELGRNSNLVIKSANLFNPDGGMKSLALDTRTGQVSNDFMGSQLDKGKSRDEAMLFHASTVHSVLPLRPEYINGKEFRLEDWKAELDNPKPVLLQPAR